MKGSKNGFSGRAVALTFTATLAAIVWLQVPGPIGLAQGEAPQFSSEFRLQECTFRSKGANPYFNLNPDYQLILEGEEMDDEGDLETVRLVITVLNEIQPIELAGIGTVKARVIEERETVDGDPEETSRNYYAICLETGDVYYFGEEVDIFNDDGTVSHEGAWIAGVDDARPGIIMPGTFLLGARYFQEMAPGVALDQAEHVEAGLQADVPAGPFDGCVRVIETTVLEPGAESEKVYCPGVGLVRDGILELVEVVDNGANDARLYFAQFGNGGGLSSEIVLTNRSGTAAVSVELKFRASDGAPLQIGTSLGGDPISQLNVDIGPTGSFRIATDGQGEEAVAGSALVTSSGPLGAVLRFSIAGFGIAGVGGGQTLSRGTAPVRQTNGIRTALAIRNSNPEHAVKVRLSLRGEDGAEGPGGNEEIMIPPNGQTAAFIDEIFDQADTDGFVGAVLLESDDDVAVIALQLGTQPGQFTTLPVSEIIG